MTLRTEPSDPDVRTRSAASRVDLGTRYVTVCVVSLVAGRSRGKLSAVFFAGRSGGKAFSSKIVTSELVRLLLVLTLEHVT
jgi:hypothetical protein